MPQVKVGNITIGDNAPLVLISGPCVIETEDLILKTAEQIKKITDKYKIPFIFKASCVKANRWRETNYLGPGLEKGLEILAKVKKNLGIPVLTDVHSASDPAIVAEVVDVIQIPAFLCRQTDIAVAAGKTGKPINLKKGQFLAPEDMGVLAGKIKSTGNNQIMLTERGVVFGYSNLVVDMRSLVKMRELGYPVVFDVSHSIQMPTANTAVKRGEPEYILPLARAGVACGCDALFIETHPDVQNAMSDRDSMLPLENLEQLLKQVTQIDRLCKPFVYG